MKKIIGVLLALVLLLTMASPTLAWRGCRRCERTGPGYAFARTFCRNPEEPVSSAEATAESPDGSATAIAISIVIVDDGTAQVTNSATAIANTGGNTQE